MIVDPGATFNGAVNGNGGSLELSGGTGSVRSIGSSSFSGFNQLFADAVASWTLTGFNSIANTQDNANLVIAGRSKLRQRSIPPAPGQFGILSGATLEIASDQATNSQIDFRSAGRLTSTMRRYSGLTSAFNLFGTADRRVRRRRQRRYPWPFADCCTTSLQCPRMECCRLQMVRAKSRPWIFKNSTLGTGNVQFRLGREQRP